MSDCERLKNDLAYNQCLAMFGPAAKNIANGGGGGGAVTLPPASSSEVAGIPVVEEPEIAQPSRRGRRGRQVRRGGRQMASFEVNSTDVTASEVEPDQPRRSRYRWRRRR